MTGPHFPVNSDAPAIDPAAVRAALDRVLATEPFQQREAQARLLRFAVEESLAGRRSHVKESRATQLRARLAEYYAAEGARDPVRIELPEDGSPAKFSCIAPPHRRARLAMRTRWIRLIAALIAGVLLVWAGSGWRARMASAQVHSLVVLPFSDLTPQKNGEWLAPSLTGEIIDALARVPGLQVVAQTSAFKVSGDAVGQLGAAAALTGSIRTSGDRLYIALQLTRTSDGYNLWSAAFNRPAQDLAAVRQATATAIAGRLQVRMPANPTLRHQPSGEAYNAYLQGRYFLAQANPEALNQAAERLEEATRIDPNFARAWAWLSIVRAYRVAAGLARPNQAMPGSRDAAERAVALEPDLGDAHLALGLVDLQYDWDWAGAKEELDRASQASPSSALALQWRGRWFQTQGRMDEAVGESERALAVDPLSASISSDMAAEYVSLNQPERAVSFAQKAADLNPDDAATRASLAQVLLFAGQTEKSRQVTGELRQSGAGAKLPAFVLPFLEAQLGDLDNARQLLDAAEDLPDEELLPAVAYVELAASIRDWDRLFSWADEAYGEHDAELPYLCRSPLVPKSDPRFDALLAELNLGSSSR